MFRDTSGQYLIFTIYDSTGGAVTNLSYETLLLSMIIINNNPDNISVVSSFTSGDDFTCLLSDTELYRYKIPQEYTNCMQLIVAPIYDGAPVASLTDITRFYTFSMQPTKEQIAAEILLNSNNKLYTDSCGYVTTKTNLDKSNYTLSSEYDKSKDAASNNDVSSITENFSQTLASIIMYGDTTSIINGPEFLIQKGTQHLISMVEGNYPNVVFTEDALGNAPVTDISPIISSINDISLLVINIPTDNTSIPAIKSRTDQLVFTVPYLLDSNVVDWKNSTAPAMTGDAYSIVTNIQTTLSDVSSNIDNLPVTNLVPIESTLSDLSSKMVHTHLDLSDISSVIQDIPTNTEFEARTILSGNYFDPTSDVVYLNATQPYYLPFGYLDASISSRMATFSYISPNDATSIITIKSQTDKLNFSGTDVKSTLDGETVTVGTNNDKTDYTLTSAYDPAKTASSQSSVNDISSKLLIAHNDISSIKGYTDSLESTLNDVSSLVQTISPEALDFSDISSWIDNIPTVDISPITNTLTDISSNINHLHSDISDTSTKIEDIPTNTEFNNRTILSTAYLQNTDSRLNYLDASISTRLATSEYTPPITDRTGYSLTSAYDSAKISYALPSSINDVSTLLRTTYTDVTTMLTDSDFTNVLSAIDDVSGLIVNSFNDSSTLIVNIPSEIDFTTVIDSINDVSTISQNIYDDAKWSYIDASISTRMATFSYIAPDNNGIQDISSFINNIMYPNINSTLNDVSSNVYTLVNTGVTVDFSDMSSLITEDFNILHSDINDISGIVSGLSTPEINVDFTVVLDAIDDVSSVINNIHSDLNHAHLDISDLSSNIGTAGSGLTALGDTRLRYLDSSISTRMQTFTYTAPDNASISNIENILGTPVALDNGYATISGMLTKMADDHSGTYYRSEYHSLYAIGHDGSKGSFPDIPQSVIDGLNKLTTF